MGNRKIEKDPGFYGNGQAGSASPESFPRNSISPQMLKVLVEIVPGAAGDSTGEKNAAKMAKMLNELVSKVVQNTR